MPLFLKLLSRLTLVLTCLWAVGCASLGEIENDKEAAKVVALRWLQALDAGDYAGAFQQMDPVARAETSQADFIKAMSTQRSRWGAMKSRQVRFADFNTSLRRRPDGRFVAVAYYVEYARKDRGGEGVILSKTAAGWQVTAWVMR